jgi:hypothetical protein
LSFVAGPRFACTLLATLPLWCGVILAHHVARGVALLELRPSRPNPFVTARTSMSLLLERERRAIQSEMGLAALEPNTANDILLETCSFQQIRSYVRSALRQRGDLRPAVPPA